MRAAKIEVLLPGDQFLLFDSRDKKARIEKELSKAGSLNLEFIRCQVRLLAEDDLALERMKVLFAKMDQVLDPHLNIQHYLFQIEYDPEFKCVVSFFDSQFIYDFKLTEENLQFSKQSLKKVKDTDLEIGKSQTTLKVIGETKLSYRIRMPEAPDELLNYQKSLSQEIAKLR